MIPAAEIQRMAGAGGVEPTRVDLDYALGWILCGLWAQSEVATNWVFKGGTCLRKCYFPGYRFSEDLDFTLTRPLAMEDGRAFVSAAAEWAEEVTGIDFTSQPPRAEIMPATEGDPGYEFRLYYRGSLPMGGSPRSVQVHLSGGEVIVTPPVSRSLNHPYSDSIEMEAVMLRCYSLAEVLAEKLRAICGQRRHAIARDLYDIHELIRRGTDLGEALAILPAKFRAKAFIRPDKLLQIFEGRRADFQRDWERNLTPLLPAADRIPFEEAWVTVKGAVLVVEGMPFEA
jgi:predicted nucleotidyltransferase component of viral defense system